MSDPIRQVIGNFPNLLVNDPKPATNKAVFKETKRTLAADSLTLGGITPAVRQKLKDFAAFAAAESAGKQPDGRSYMHVMNFIDKQGFGNVSAARIPDEYGRYARQFAEYADQNLTTLGLRKLSVTNPFEAPPGALVVLKPGAPGTAHPTAGDISVRTETGFANGGEVQYGRPGDFKPGDVLGVYIPAR